ncbi:reduced folate transporter isoform X2 [Varanus komodoensis]|uniref:reduced folate transporter isoform X2 n=1 Tax=Varanus komodoensis TaxID=61221 RepID=UPI001CF76C53|nr:reduced folate transporter isoform X2 [Varanus komodoensis]
MAAEAETPEEHPPDPPPDSRWKLLVFYLCFYGFMSQIKPGESFITPYLLGTEKNFSKEQVTNEIIPVLSYSYMAVLVPIFLLTDYLRYTPVLLLQSISHISIWLLLIFGTSILAMQFMEFFYGVTLAARVAYSSYIFSLVTPSRYQRMASYSRSAVLMGVFISSTLGQLCVTVGGVTFTTLNYVSLGFMCFGLILTFFLQRPKHSLFFNRREPVCNGTSPAELDRMNPGTPGEPGWHRQASAWKNLVLFRMLKELAHIIRVPQLRLWSLWWIFNSAGYYLMVYYVQILWKEVDPTSDYRKVYNGGVEAASTLLGAITSFSAGYVKIRWKLWSELVIAVATAFQAGLLLLMNTTTDIWVCYFPDCCFLVQRTLCLGVWNQHFACHHPQEHHHCHHNRQERPGSFSPSSVLCLLWLLHTPGCDIFCGVHDCGSAAQSMPEN